MLRETPHVEFVDGEDVRDLFQIVLDVVWVYA